MTSPPLIASPPACRSAQRHRPRAGRRPAIPLAFAALWLTLGVSHARADPFRCPQTGGSFVYGQATDFGSLDPMASDSIATRNIAMNLFESLMTRDENNHPILELAAALHESADHLTYAFTLRQGVRFHDGHPLTAADVAASFDRYAAVGLDRGLLVNVDHWDTPDPASFVVHMKQAQPTFIQALSSFSDPIVIMPAADRDVAVGQLTHPVGTGPFQLSEAVPGSLARLKRFDLYRPNPSFQDRTGMGGYKLACLDSVTFRIIADPAARLAGLRGGQLQAAEDLPPAALPALTKDRNLTPLPLRNWRMQMAVPNLSNPPTDRLLVRQAVQAALDMDPIMQAATGQAATGQAAAGQAATGGGYHLNIGFQYADQADYTDAGGETYNQHDLDLARRDLAAAGYRGEPLVLLATHDDPSIYNAALVIQRQLQAVGFNAQLKVLDGPEAARLARDSIQGWNLHVTAWATRPALGVLSTMQRLVQPMAAEKPADGKDDPDLLAAWQQMNTASTQAARRQAFARMQLLALQRVYALPLGAVDQLQAVRANVNNYVPFRIPRLANVWLSR